MTAAIVTPSASADSPRAELARLCRKICLAHEESSPSGHSLPLDDELARALATIRAAYGENSVHEEDLVDLYRAEQLRVADAAVLAELLAPKVAAYLKSHGLSASPFPEDTSPPFDPPASPRPSPTFSASPTPPAAPNGPLGIADLLDGMLAQDRENERTRRIGPRR